MKKILDIGEVAYFGLSPPSNKGAKMRQQIEQAIIELQHLWKNLNAENIDKIRMTIENLVKTPEVLYQLQKMNRDLTKGVELHRDPTHGSILLAYSEEKDFYRIPHNHGDAWVVYAVVAGHVDMGNYSAVTLPNGNLELLQKSKETLRAGDTQIYHRGDIHDTRCISENAIILRLTSHDLREEERAGRMKRYQI